MLSKLRIVSFCHYLQGPAATQYLADMGADVIKVEAVGGAYERHWSGANVFVDGVSSFFLAANRNKRVIALDLKSPEGLEIALRLIDTADAVVENFRPGVLDRLGLGYEALRKRKPDLIYASASGYGLSGPMRDSPGQDLLIQARTGLVAATGGGATSVGATVCDQHGGALLALGILGAYVRRQATGEGCRVEGSLFNAGIDLQVEPITNYLTAGKDASCLQRDPHLASWYHQAPYGIYETKDGRRVAISLNDPKAFADALDDPTLHVFVGSDPMLERDPYAEATAAAVKRYNYADLAVALDAARMWWAPVHDYAALASDPQALHYGIFREVEVRGGRATLVSHPIRYDGEAPGIRHLAVEIGQHTREILQELGFAPEEIERMAKTKAVGGPDLLTEESAVL
jgi:crotonobetainyl-CoA:carnitine CoA-transferase CaiB-like acyl-CoA transferase